MSERNNEFNNYEAEETAYTENINVEKPEIQPEYSHAEAFETQTVYSESETSKTQEKKKSGAGKVAKKAGAILLSGVLFGAVAGGSMYGVNNLLDGKDNKSTEASTNNKTPNSGESGKNQLITSDKIATGSDASNLTVTGDYLTIAEIADNCLPSVVAITNLGVSEIQTFWGNYEQESESAGSGIIIGQSDEELIILTNYHVVSDSKELTVVFSFDEDSEEPDAVTANVKGYDEERDIAVIAIDIENINAETLNNIKIAVIGNSDDIVLGEQVVAIGNALGYGQSVTTGIISVKSRYVELAGTDGTTISNDYIQTDAAINPGNSGGALFNMKGELIGVNSAKVSDSSVEGMGYAIPISDVYDLVTELMNREVRIPLSEEEQGYLCMSGEDVSSEAVQYYGIPEGAYVISVYEDYAADKAGIKTGDIVTAVNGVAVDSMTALKKELSYYEGGAEVTITIYRQNDKSGFKEMEVTVVLNDYDDFTKLQQEQSSKSNSSSGNKGSGSYPSYDDFFGFGY